MFAPRGSQPEENENSVAVRFRRAGALQEMERHQRNRYGEKVADVDVMDSLVPEVVHRKQAQMRPKSRTRMCDDPTQKMEAIARSALEMRSSMEGELQKLRQEKEVTCRDLKASMDGELAKLKRERSLAQADLKRSMQAEVARLKSERDAEVCQLKRENETLRLRKQPVELLKGPRGAPNSARSLSSVSLSPESVRPMHSQTMGRKVSSASLSPETVQSQTMGRRLMKRLPLRSQSSVDVVGDEVRELRKRNAALQLELRKTRPASAACLETAPFASHDFFAQTQETDNIGSLAACLDEFPENLRQGAFLWKVPFHATGAAPQKRWFRIALRKGAAHAPDEVVLTWGSSSTKAEATASKDRSVALEDVLELKEGHKTQAWWVQANAGRLIPPEDLCWSLVCKDRTLDLAVEDGENAKAWRRGLKGAISVLQNERRKRFEGDDDDTINSDDEEVRSVASSSLLGSARSPKQNVAAPRFRLALERGDAVAARRLLGAAKVNRGDAVLANRSYATDTGGKVETPLHGAARTGNVLLVQLLLEHHADARARDGVGATPAHVAIRARADGARDVLAVLLDAAGDDVLEARDNAGDVPLHVACRAGALECVRLLLETAADPLAKNNRGETPSAFATYEVLALVAEYAPAAEDAPAVEDVPPAAGTEDDAFEVDGAKWVSRLDPASNYPYYENQATGATQWTDPREAEVIEVAAEPEVAAEAPEVEAVETEPEVVEVAEEVAEAPAAAPQVEVPVEAPAPAPKKVLSDADRFSDRARKPLFSITNSLEATG